MLAKIDNSQLRVGQIVTVHLVRTLWVRDTEEFLVTGQIKSITPSKVVINVRTTSNSVELMNFPYRKTKRLVSKKDSSLGTQEATVYTSPEEYNLVKTERLSKESVQLRQAILETLDKADGKTLHDINKLLEKFR